MNILPEVRALAEEILPTLEDRFAELDRLAMDNTERVLDAFQAERVSESMFSGTTGYGYDDIGRDTLDRIYARVFGAEAALVRIGFVNGTHAIAAALFAALAPGDRLLSLTGLPYDTIRTVIGIEGDAVGSLKYYGIGYCQCDMDEDPAPYLADPAVRAVLIQRSRGYDLRRALCVEELEQRIARVKQLRPDVFVIVDNCYGEFTQRREPTACGADLCAGSLIKNPGGGLALTGGYICGSKELVERAAYRLTVPGIGAECGASLGQNRAMYQGLFVAPHVTVQALKTAVFCSRMLSRLGFATSPDAMEERGDIVQTITLGSADRLVRFCAGVQAASPVDAYVSPEPWQMPGYDCEVVMASGAFVSGSTSELGCDGPLREPYVAYMQGGLTKEAGFLGVMSAISSMLAQRE